ncbi:MAG: hypothetical protein ACC742_09175 [Thermoanaerobaculales bacterium]
MSSSGLTALLLEPDDTLRIPACWIADREAAPPEPAAPVVGQGSLQDFFELATGGELEIPARKELAG